MAYCTITDIRALNPKRTYSVSSTPTQAQVEALINQVAAEIDTIVSGRGLPVPVTDPSQFVAHLKQVNAYGAAALAEMGMFPESMGIAETPHGKYLWTIYSQMTAQLKKGDLPAAIQSGDPRSFFEQHPVTEPTEDYEWRKPKFGKDKVF